MGIEDCKEIKEKKITKVIVPTATDTIAIHSGFRSVNDGPKEPAVFVNAGEDRWSQFSLNEVELTNLIETLQSALVTAQQDFVTKS